MILIWRDGGTLTMGRLVDYLELAESGMEPNLCLPVPRPFPKAKLEITTVEYPNDFFYAGPVFVVSEALKVVMERFPIRMEFLELEAWHCGQPFKDKNYYYGNNLDAVTCFDYDNSIYEMTDDGPEEISKLVLDESKALGHHFFIVGEVPGPMPNPKAMGPIIRCASSDLATEVLKSGVTGVVFTKPEDWQSYPAPAWQPS